MEYKLEYTKLNDTYEINKLIYTSHSDVLDISFILHKFAETPSFINHIDEKITEYLR